MTHHVLRKGAIACSVVFLYNGAQPAAIQPDTCENNLPNTSTWASIKSNSSRPGSHCSKRQLQKSSIAPENLLNALWSGRRTNRLPNEMEERYEKLVKQAKADAKRDRLVTALSTVMGIPKNSRHYQDAQQLQEEWSQELLQQATQHYQKANLIAALSLIKTIPTTTQNYQRATELKHRWSRELTLVKQAQVAKNNGNWQQVMNTLSQLEETQLYHSLAVQTLLQQATNHLLEPNKTLVQIATNPSTLSDSPSIPIQSSSSLNQPNATAPSLEPLPQPDHLVVGVSQALKWAQPPAAVQYATSDPASKAIAATRKIEEPNQSVRPLFPVPKKVSISRTAPTISPSSVPSIAPPETVPLLPD